MTVLPLVGPLDEIQPPPGLPPMIVVLVIPVKFLLWGLHNESTSFRSVLNEARSEAVRQLLAETKPEVTDIALAFSYADTSVFRHAFAAGSI
jgi:hypothetical protein